MLAVRHLTLHLDARFWFLRLCQSAHPDATDVTGVTGVEDVDMTGKIDIEVPAIGIGTLNIASNVAIGKQAVAGKYARSEADPDNEATTASAVDEEESLDDEQRRTLNSVLQALPKSRDVVSMTDEERSEFIDQFITRRCEVDEALTKWLKRQACQRQHVDLAKQMAAVGRIMSGDNIDVEAQERALELIDGKVAILERWASDLKSGSSEADIEMQFKEVTTASRTRASMLVLCIDCWMTRVGIGILTHFLVRNCRFWISGASS